MLLQHLLEISPHVTGGMEATSSRGSHHHDLTAIITVDSKK